MRRSPVAEARKSATAPAAVPGGRSGGPATAWMRPTSGARTSAARHAVAGKPDPGNTKRPLPQSFAAQRTAGAPLPKTPADAQHVRNALTRHIRQGPERKIVTCGRQSRVGGAVIGSCDHAIVALAFCENPSLSTIVRCALFSACSVLIRPPASCHLPADNARRRPASGQPGAAPGIHLSAPDGQPGSQCPVRRRPHPAATADSPGARR